MRISILTISFIIAIAIGLMSMFPSNQSENKKKGFDIHNHALLRVPVDSSILFAPSIYCQGCHGHDPNGRAFIAANGQDVNIFDSWQATMMANSARDPFWRAKVSHEITINPAHSAELQDKCTSCHAPMGRYTKSLRGHGMYSINDLVLDTVGIDGVSCVACHYQSPIGIGTTNSGIIHYDTSRTAYGPYLFPFDAPMTSFVHITPAYSPHVLDAGMCAACHTLVTHTVDLSGNFTGNSFVEQATYHEWLNSVYNQDKEKTTCQTCHMPQLTEGIQIATDYPSTEYRTPFGIHEFAGANTMMLKLMKANKTALGIKASDANFDSTLAATTRMLQQKSIALNTTLVNTTNDSIFFNVSLQNLAGHKFPSGYPSRRAYVEFVVLKSNGDTLFKSGRINSNFEVEGHDANYEPHYNVINNQNQVQIYEMVMADVNNNVTTILERAKIPLKDNRIPPIGFTTSHVVYDTVRIFGVSSTDTDFNQSGGFDGSGIDILHYHIPRNGYTGNISVSTKVYYQSLPPKWMQEMFSVNTQPINDFKAMFNSADRAPLLVASNQLNATILGLYQSTNANIPIQLIQESNNVVRINMSEQVDILNVQIFDSNGKIVSHMLNKLERKIVLSKTSGLFFIQIKTNEGTVTKRLVLR